MSVNNPSSNIGSRIRQLRKQRKLTQEELGEQTGVNYSYIGQIERGDKTPSLKTLIKIAEGLDVTLGYLIQETPPTYHDKHDNALHNELLRLVHDCTPKELALIVDVVRAIKRNL
jgi:transcriptional regulator with XRE-family HTH domain